MNYTSYLLRRLLYMAATLVIISVLIYIVIQLPPGDAVDTIVAQRESEGDVITEAEELALRRQYGLDRPLFVQYADWVTEFLFGRHGALDPWRARERPDQRTARRHHHAVADQHPVHLPGGDPDRHLQRHPPVQPDRLQPDHPGIHRAGDAQLPAGTDPAVRVLQVLRAQHRRLLLARHGGAAVEHGQAAGPDRPPVDTGHRDRHGSHRRHDPGHARHAARRAGQTVRDHGPRERGSRSLA